MHQQPFRKQPIDPQHVFLVSTIDDQEPSNNLAPEVSVVTGARSTQAALSAHLERHPGKSPISVVSLAELERDVQLVRAAAEGRSEPGVELIEVAA